MTDTITIPNTALDTPATVSGQIAQKFTEAMHYLRENAGEIAVGLFWKLLIIAAIVLLARLVLALVSVQTRSIMSKDKYHRTEQQGKRVDTLMTLMRSLARYAIYFVALILILQQFHLDSLVKGALTFGSIFSLALGIGAQSFVKDVVTGFFMMFENQIAVGDYVRIDDTEGYVEAIALRVTYLRDWKGEQYILANGSITRITNFSRGDSIAVVYITVSYKADTRAVIGVIEQTLRRFEEEYGEIIVSPPYVRGVTDTTEKGVQISVACKVKSLKHWETERTLRLMIKEDLEHSGLPFPYPQIIETQYGHPAPAPQEPVRAAYDEKQQPDDPEEQPTADDSPQRQTAGSTAE